MTETRKDRNFMCYDCQSATSVVNNPKDPGRYKCSWCGKLNWGTHVDNKKPEKK